ncbi:MAG: MFS transporter, partial [Mailhella sp.]|nr:MFS transporter [Mailhella sp.]
MDYKKISLISLGHLSCDINAHALPALLPYLAAAHDFDYQTCGLLAFAYSAVSSIVQPILGLVADKFSRGWFIPLGILMAGVGFGFTGFLDTAPAIFLALLIAGVGGAVFHPEGARYANIVSGQRKGVGLSIFSVGGNGGMVMGPLLVMFAVAGFPVAGFTVGGFGLG